MVYLWLLYYGDPKLLSHNQSNFANFNDARVVKVWW